MPARCSTAASTTGRGRQWNSAAAALAEPLDRVAVLGHRGEEPLAVLLVSRHQRELDLRARHRHVDAFSMVLDRDQVPPLLRDEREQLDQLAGPVRELRPGYQITAGGGQ